MPLSQAADLLRKGTPAKQVARQLSLPYYVILREAYALKITLRRGRPPMPKPPTVTEAH
jgi:hypothetical protein